MDRRTVPQCTDAEVEEVLTYLRGFATHREAAAAVGMHQPEISRYLVGHRRPGRELLRRVRGGVAPLSRRDAYGNVEEVAIRVLQRLDYAAWRRVRAYFDAHHKGTK